MSKTWVTYIYGFSYAGQGKWDIKKVKRKLKKKYIYIRNGYGISCASKVSGT